MLRFKQSATGVAGANPTAAAPVSAPCVPVPAAPPATRRAVNVGMGQVIIGGREAELVISGLGSCIGLAIWSPTRKVGALAHVVLPTSKGTPPSNATPAKFADWAVPKIIDELAAQGAQRDELVAKMAGGAHPLAASSADVGRQSAEAIEYLLSEAGVPISGKSIGGTVGRAVHFLPETGVFEVKQMNGAAQAI